MGLSARVNTAPRQFFSPLTAYRCTKSLNPIQHPSPRAEALPTFRPIQPLLPKPTFSVHRQCGSRTNSSINRRKRPENQSSTEEQSPRARQRVQSIVQKTDRQCPLRPQPAFNDPCSYRLNSDRDRIAPLEQPWLPYLFSTNRADRTSFCYRLRPLP